MGSRARIVQATVCALIAVSLAAPASAAGHRKTTRFVDDDGKAGPTSCGGQRRATTRIQSAIDRSDRNDVVIVCPGSYTGTIRIEGPRNGLTVRAYSKGTAIITPRRSLIEGPLVWISRVSDVTVQGFTLAFPSTGCDTHVADVNGMFARDADGLRVVGNTLHTTGTDTQGPCGYDDGIRAYSSSRVRVSGNVVRDFKSDGISFEKGSRGKIDGNSVRFYHRSSGSDDDGEQGIRVVDGARAEVTGNVVRSLSGVGTPHLEVGIVVEDGGGVSDIHHNVVSYTRTGIGVIDSNARVRSNDVTGVGQRQGIHILGGTGAEVLSNDVRAYDIGIEVEATGTALRGNDARGNMSQSCLDETSGDGTAGTGNTWSNNVGSPASAPVEICPVP